MGILDEMREVGDLIKKAGDVDLYRRIVKLEGEVIDLTRANRQAENKIEELQSALSLKAELYFFEPFYWTKGNATPYCPSCWETKTTAIHVLFGYDNANGSSLWTCPNCKHMYYPRLLRQALVAGASQIK